MTADRDNVLVVPFYLKMMRLNALEHGADLAPAILEASVGVTPDDVIALLREPWRATVMGAWLSVIQTDLRVTDEVLAALARSHGSLDASPLTVAAVLLAAGQALPTLEVYLERDLSAEWGAARFVAAAIEHLGGSAAGCSPNDSDLRHFTAMLAVGQRLRTGS